MGIVRKEGEKGISDSYGITLYGGYTKQTDRNMMSLARGSAEYKVSLSELTSAYQIIERNVTTRH